MDVDEKTLSTEKSRGGRPPRSGANGTLKVTVSNTDNAERARERGASLADSADLKAIKVSANSTTRGLAGAVAKLARENRRVEILAGSAACVNTAVKAVVTARRYLSEDGVDVALVATVATRRDSPEHSRRKSLELAMCPILSADAKTYADEAVEYTCGANTSSQALAGALAARFRDGKSATVKCIGATAVLRALTACGLGAAYAQTNVDMFPSFESVEKKDGDGKISVMSLSMKLVL